MNSTILTSTVGAEVRELQSLVLYSLMYSIQYPDHFLVAQVVSASKKRKCTTTDSDEAVGLGWLVVWFQKCGIGFCVSTVLRTCVPRVSNSFAHCV